MVHKYRVLAGELEVLWLMLPLVSKHPLLVNVHSDKHSHCLQQVYTVITTTRQFLVWRAGTSNLYHLYIDGLANT